MTARPKRLVVLTVVATALIFGAAYGWHWYRHNRYLESTDDAYVRADAVAIQPQIRARIAKVGVRENQDVHKGQILIELNSTDARARLEKAGAESAAARATLSDVSARMALQHRTIDKVQASLDAARAELHRAGLELRRSEALAHKSFGSRQRLQNAHAAQEVARARLAQAKAELASSQQMLAVLAAKRARAKAHVAAAQADADFAKNQLAKTTVVAPGDGVVGDLGARVGAMAEPGTTLLHLVPVPDVYVVANFKETQISRMGIGEPVAVRADAYPGVVFKGVVASLAPATGTEFSLLPRDNATGNFNKIVQRVPVRIRVTGPAGPVARLRPGLSVVAQVDTSRPGPGLSYIDDNDATLAVR